MSRFRTVGARSRTLLVYNGNFCVYGPEQHGTVKFNHVTFISFYILLCMGLGHRTRCNRELYLCRKKKKHIYPVIISQRLFTALHDEDFIITYCLSVILPVAWSYRSQNLKSIFAQSEKWCPDQMSWPNLTKGASINYGRGGLKIWAKITLRI